MVFSSVDFLFLFFPVFLLAQSILPKTNLTFVLLSVVFFFVGEGWYTIIVLVSVVANFLFGLLIDHQADPRRRKVVLGISVAVNLASLTFFKYAGFFAEALFGVQKGAWITSIHLPMGISFFTFHAISYLVDTYRREVRAERSFVNLLLYMLMFPQLIAGPILRYHTVASQLRRRVVASRHVYYGLMLLSLGLGQKVLLADTLGGIADPLFARYESLSTGTAWLAAVAYTLQIFFDFDGYSNMAIGLGWVCGFFFPENFDFPYISRSITEFWRRWHMSLSRWFRDYVYISLGGNRRGALVTYRNLLIVFILCGLWHGAAWMFVIWGAYHGLLLVIERLGGEKVLRRLPIVFQHVYTLLAVVIGWIFFRTESVAQATSMLSKMFLFSGAPDTPIGSLLTGEEMAVLAIAALFSTPLVSQAVKRFMAVPFQKGWPAWQAETKYAVGIACGCAIFGAAAVKVLTGAYSPFIYFRF